MKLLVVTEKCSPSADQRDGGARLVQSLIAGLRTSADVMQFSIRGDESRVRRATFEYVYPEFIPCKFTRRIANKAFVASKLIRVASAYDAVLFVHVSMQFCLVEMSSPSFEIWTFPMFLSPSYRAGGERVPAEYAQLERDALRMSDRVITPSYLEKSQLIADYAVDPAKIRVIPRGVVSELFQPKARTLDGSLRLCSVGSVKQQKNTLGVVETFAQVKARFPSSHLTLVGPSQEPAYHQAVVQATRQHGLEDSITWAGYVPHCHLPSLLADQHVHLSLSRCETFGRSIFETLALGLPNLVLRSNNAAFEFLADRPYIRFLDSSAQVVDALDGMLGDYAALSESAAEIGEIFDDRVLRHLVAAEIERRPVLAVSDYDGTLFFKTDESKSNRSVQVFNRFDTRVLCTARSLDDIQNRLRLDGLLADFIICYSGAMIADGRGNVLRCIGLDESHRIAAKTLAGEVETIAHNGWLLQFSVQKELSICGIAPLRSETYQGLTFFLHPEATKLRAVLWLLRHIGHRGRVRAFGDGKYDEQLLTYFDGALIRPHASDGASAKRSALEICYEPC